MCSGFSAHFDTQSHMYVDNLFFFFCRSNTEEPYPIFSLVAGKTEQTNKENTFSLTAENTTAHIRLIRTLDYEMLDEYLLTVRIEVRG